MYSSSFLPKGTYDEYGDAALVYYNIDLIHSNTKSNQSLAPVLLDSNYNPPARFTEVRTTPIIYNASNFEMAIISADLNGATKRLPLFIPMIDTNQIIDVNKTVYWVGEGDPTICTASLNVTYVPTDPTITAPTSALSQNLSNPYYYVYTYNQFLQMINTQLSALSFGGSVTKPFIRYNSDSGLFDLLMPATLVTGNYYVYFNTDLFNLFSSFPYTKVAGVAPITTDDNCMYRINTNIDQQKQETINAVAYVVVPQEYNTTNNMWSPVQSIVFASTLLPVLNEKTSTPLIFDDQNDNTTVKTSSNAFNSVILEFKNEFKEGADIVQNISYTPSAEFKMMSLTGSNTPITNVDIIVYWRNRLDNQLNQLYLPNFSNITIKMLFRRKN